MKWKKRAALGGALAAAAVAAAVGSAAWWGGSHLVSAGPANPRTPGIAAPNILSPELGEMPVAQGSMKLENGTADVPYYGYDGDGTMVPLPGTATEASKTEPDKNTYLVFPQGLGGPDPSYDYGTHFLFQGHEAGTTGYITRINLDADGAHHITLLGTQTSTGTPLNVIDGSTWDPWAKRLLFTTEDDPDATGVYQATPGYPSTIDDVSAWLGRAGFEGIQNDDHGNVYVLEDVSGAKGTGANSTTRRPNSFVYRFLPNDPTDLTQGGTIQALQVLVNGDPLTFGEGGGTADQAINAPDYLALHQYGTSYPTKWITIATTNASTVDAPDLNTLAKDADATPFKRPENGQFRPGSGFRQFFFDETGDTDIGTNGPHSGGFTGVFKLQQSPGSDDGHISIFYNGDSEHAGFDNVAFFSRDKLAFVEDAGDTLHRQRNALDSGYLFDVTADYSTGLQPLRFLAEGRDASATLDAAWGFSNNSGDNEITGIHVSNGDPGKQGILGEHIPKPFNADGSWRVFYTQQHGDNFTWEIVRNDR
jgi:hypothetical protein